MDLIVTIVRHGNTFAAGEAPRRIGARTDLPLVASGQDQARALGEAFAAQGTVFDHAMAAPLLRTRETAAFVLARLPQAPALRSAPWLTEIDHGPDENRSESEVIARIGQDALAAWDADAHAPDGWIVASAARLRAWRALLTTGQGNILIVTSNGAGRFALLCDPALRAQAERLDSLKLRTGAYGRIFREGSALRLAEWDRRPDLPPAAACEKAGI